MPGGECLLGNDPFFLGGGGGGLFVFVLSSRFAENTTCSTRWRLVPSILGLGVYGKCVLKPNQIVFNGLIKVMTFSSFPIICFSFACQLEMIVPQKKKEEEINKKNPGSVREPGTHDMLYTNRLSYFSGTIYWNTSDGIFND